MYGTRAAVNTAINTGVVSPQKAAPEAPAVAPEALETEVGTTEIEVGPRAVDAHEVDGEPHIVVFAAESRLVEILAAVESYADAVEADADPAEQATKLDTLAAVVDAQQTELRAALVDRAFGNLARVTRPVAAAVVDAELAKVAAAAVEVRR